MSELKVGDIVTRPSYGGDVSFVITDIVDRGGKKIFVLRGLIKRLEADAEEKDLRKESPQELQTRMQQHYSQMRRMSTRNSFFNLGKLFSRVRSKPGTILHIDSSKDFMDRCASHYKEAGINAVTYRADEKDQPSVVRQLLERNQADILVLTGHDGIKKEGGVDSVDNYRTSKYFIQAVKEARRFEGSKDKLCIVAGACQSYYEGIMGAGANFASSPGRILINALDPAIASRKVATTDTKTLVTPQEIARMTISGKDGIWGINTKGHMTWV